MSAGPSRRPLIGVMCGNEVAGRPVQAAATRFLKPLVEQADAAVLLVPAVPDAVDAGALSGMLDGLLLTGSRTHVSPSRYGGAEAVPDDALDPDRDAVAFALADRMIARGRPVFGICRGFQELNVLFGGTLAPSPGAGRHHHGSWADDHDRLFGHRHEVTLAPAGFLSRASGVDRATVTSVHQQGVGRLGTGLTVEALADDGLVEAFHARPGIADVLAVQWHPECDADRSPVSRAFFASVGRSLRGEALTRLPERELS